MDLKQMFIGSMMSGGNTEEIEALQQQVATLTEENESLSEENATLESENVTLTQQNTTLKNNNATLTEQNETLSAEIKTLNSSNHYSLKTREYTAVTFNIQQILTHIEIPDVVQKIYADGNKQGGFSMCYYLESIVLPKTLTSLGAYAFNDCYRLAYIYYRGTSSQWSAISKDNTWNTNMGSNVSGGTKIIYNYTG